MDRRAPGRPARPINLPTLKGLGALHHQPAALADHWSAASSSKDLPAHPKWVDVFPGGCVTYQPEPDIGPSAPLLDQAQRAVTYRTRDDLRQALRRRSGGRLDLDPRASPTALRQ